MPFTAVNVKKALSPIPGATTMGLRAYSPIIRLQKNDSRMVAVSTPLNGSPAWLRIAGLTTMIYIVARNVEIPARTSVRREAVMYTGYNFCFGTGGKVH
jgi:hypothetical protein